VYDAPRSQTLIFGGYTDVGNSEFLSGSTYTKASGGGWTLASSAGPDPRASALIACDTLRQRVVLWGGARQTLALGVFSDTWEWDGSSWFRRTQNNASPPFMAPAFMCFDPVRGVCVLLANPNRQQLQHWEWDGSAWTQRDGAGLPDTSQTMWEARSLAFDPMTQRPLAILQPYINTSLPRQTLTFDGTAWVALPSDPPENLPQITFDTIRNVGTAIDTRAATVWEFGPAASTPTIPAPPTDQTGCIGRSVTLSIVASGEQPLGLQWRKGRLAGGAMIPIPGATAPSLTFAYARASDAGRYDCIVTSRAGVLASRIISPQATLHICPADVNCDGMVTSQDVFDFVTYWFAGCTGQPGATCHAFTCDVDGVPGLSPVDLLTFLNQWFAGC
ncbi:MAG TPA: immunoglobulin domain-containing protein, partial [Phycisphaerales bacterium]|nr:immunoglobulin domain-containing protein [Phycisphaerales bacterium]